MAALVRNTAWVLDKSLKGQDFKELHTGAFSTLYIETLEDRRPARQATVAMDNASGAE